MNIIERKKLVDFTTFKIGGEAKFFCIIKNKKELEEAVHFAREKSLPIFILGGGSNILVSDKGFDGLVLKINIRGKIVQSPESKFESKEGEVLDIFLHVGAGEGWDDFVAWTVDRGYGGLENLSLIPGTVGAAPVQNIGAYGVEVGNVIESVEVFDLIENSFKTFSKKECKFSYRDSIFKREKIKSDGKQGRYVITSVLFKLSKDSEPDISYKDLKEYFESKGKNSSLTKATEDRQEEKIETKNMFSTTIEDKSQKKHDFRLTSPSISEVREAVKEIRTAKLPDLKKVGTAGSFFKNPIVSKEKYSELKEKFSELPSFPESGSRVKIPLAWIIDKVCDLKGKKFGKAGIHETQALVIVNYGGASFKDVEKVSSEVEKMVKEKTGIEIDREVIMV